MHGHGGETNASASSLLLVDARRAQSILIGLARFRYLAAADTVAATAAAKSGSGRRPVALDAVAYRPVLDAVYSLDSLGNEVNGELLDTLRPLLPTDGELRRLHQTDSSR